MRLIDADALTILLHDDIDGLDEEFPNDKQVKPYMCGVKMALSFIETAPTVDAVPRWIPCEERLPEPIQEVLVTGTNGCVYTSRIVHGEFEYGGNVIAWMPLPEPYEGERRDDD